MTKHWTQTAKGRKRQSELRKKWWADRKKGPQFDHVTSAALAELDEAAKQDGVNAARWAKQKVVEDLEEKLKKISHAIEVIRGI